MSVKFFIVDIDHNILVLLLDFVYTGKLLLSSQSVWNVLTAASQLELTDAPQLCRKFIDTHLNIDNTSDSLLEVSRFFTIIIMWKELRKFRVWINTCRVIVVFKFGRGCNKFDTGAPGAFMIFKFKSSMCTVQIDIYKKVKL